MKTDKTDNEIIAEFMNEVVFQKRPRHYIGVTENMKPYKLADKLKYNTSWDWLMPVVDKIEGYLSTPGASETPGWDHWNDVFDGDINTDIEVAYPVVIEFIKWYNNQQSK